MERIILIALTLALATGALASASKTPEKDPVQECNIGLERLQNGQFQQALESINRCLSIPLSRDNTAYMLQARADTYFELKKYKLAIKDQKLSLEIAEPKDVWPWVMLGMFYRETNQFELALEALSNAHKYDEDSPGTGPGMAVYYHTGKTYFKMGNHKKAIQAFTEGIPKQPDYGWVYYHRGLAYEALGNHELAEADFSHAHKLRPKEGYEPEIASKLSKYVNNGSQ